MSDLPLTDDWLATPGRFLWHPPTRTAVLSDLHLGYELDMTRRGNFMPEYTAKPLAAAWQRVCERAPLQIIVAGDLFHSASPDPATIAAARHLLAQVPADCRVTVLPGNHDPALRTLRTIFAGAAINVAASADAARWSVFHGHDLAAPLPLMPHRGLIVGHQHPAVVLADRVQNAKMLCFATFSYSTSVPGGPHPRECPVIVLPAFSPAPLGSNLLTEHHWILALPAPPAERVRIAGLVGERVLDFGPLSALRRL